jgi:serine/threonine-protein kinase
VALKRLHPYLVADPTARARLLREAAVLQSVDHPAIVRPRELIADPDDPALVMEFAQGRSIQQRIAEDGPFPPDEAVAIMGVVADALAVAHEAGILHRDVKPANILVEESGAVHLVDFGIASVAETDKMALTATQTVVGTLRYTAPERLAGEPASPRSDVWALGAVLHEMLTGEPAIAGTDPGTVGHAVNGAAPGLDEAPPAVAAVVRLALSPEPANRYPNAGAFRDALSRLDAGADQDAPTALIPIVAASPATARPVAARLSPVDRLASVFFGGVLLVALAAAVALGVGASFVPSASSAPTVAPSVAATPVTENAAASPVVEDDSKGKGKGRGNDGENHGNGNGDDD